MLIKIFIQIKLLCKQLEINISKTKVIKLRIEFSKWIFTLCLMCT